MNHRFKSSLADLKENDPSQADNQHENGYTKFETIGHARNLVFIWADGLEMNCQYAYLVNTKYNAAESTITLNFTDQAVTITGSYLKQLHTDLRYQLVEEIRQINPRYAAIAEDDECIITEITLTNHKG